MRIRTPATVLLAVTVAACGPAPEPSAPGTTPPASSASVPASSAAPSAPSTPGTNGTASPQQLVTEIAVRDSDLFKGYRIETVEHGDEVAGQVTFDLCGHTFASEAHRVARHQGGIVSSSGESQGAANEVVAYDSEASAASALEEFRTAVRDCPRNKDVPSGVAGGKPRRYLAASVRTDRRLPARDNAVAVLTLRKAGSGSKVHQLVIVQRQGAVLDNLYVSQPEAVIDSDVTTAIGVATPTGRRLVELARQLR